jgi:peroxiredoxin
MLPQSLAKQKSKRNGMVASINQTLTAITLPAKIPNWPTPLQCAITMATPPPQIGQAPMKSAFTASSKIALLAGLALLSMPVYAALKTGTRAKDFTTRAVLAGEEYSYNLNRALAKGPVVLYFYPKAFTSGCTVEAHEFSEAADEFAGYGASIIGMSADTVATLKKFSVEACRNKFTVGVASKAVIKTYDVSLPVMGGSDRTTYVIAPNGTVIFAYSKLSVKGHVYGALQAVKAWRAANPVKK